MPELPLAGVFLLEKSHDVADFDCGKAPLNEFLIKHAVANQAGGAARSYVLTRGNSVVAYYSLAPASAEIENMPARFTKGQGRYPVPVILMARFAIDSSEQGQGLGKVLFLDALKRAVLGADMIGGRAFMVHAKDEEALAFYTKRGMEASPNNPFTMYLLFKDIRRNLGL